MEDLPLISDDNIIRTQEISQIGEQNVVKETVGLDLGNSSNKKQKMLRSDVWDNFEKHIDENGKEWAMCNTCNVKKDGSSRMGTTHLKNHFNSCSKNKKNEGGGSASGDKPAVNSVIGEYTTFLMQPQNVNQQVHLPRIDNLLALCPLQSSSLGFQSLGTSNPKAYRGVEDIFSFKAPYSSPYMSYLSPNYSFDGKPSRTSSKAQWVKLKAVVRWAFFIRKKAAERRALTALLAAYGMRSPEMLKNDEMQHRLLRILNTGGRGQGSASGDKPAENSNQTQEISHIGEQNVVKETVGLDIVKFSSKKKKKLRSDVWCHFEKYTDEIGKEWAICNICKKPFNGSSKMGTTHLKNHFKSCSQNISYEGGDSASGDKPAENYVMDQQLNSLNRVKMLIKQSSEFEPLLKSIETADIINVYNEEKEKLRIYFEKLPCRFSLMITAGNKPRFGRYICFSVYFIDDDWKLKEKIINLKCIGRDPIMKILNNVLSEWGIDNNISYMVLDGYSYDYVLSSNERENGFSSQGSLLFNGKLLCIRDFDYVLSNYSDCIHDIEGVIWYHMKNIFEYIRGNEMFCSAIDRARSSGKKVTTGVIPTEQDLADWEIMDLVETGLGLKEAFFELEIMDIEFKSINLTKEEWDLITTFYDLNDGTLWYDYKTANMCFSWLCCRYMTIMISLELVKLKPFIDKKERFQSFRDGMKCWYDDNLVLAVAAVLDPRFKMDVVEHWYKKIYGDEYETRLAIFTDYLTGVYNEYAKGTNDLQSSVSGSEEKKSAVSYKMLKPSGKPCKFSQDHHRSELGLYLDDIKFPLIEDLNVLDWWRFNTQYFPTLAKMARDFLSIQITIPPDHLYYRTPKPHMNFDSDMVKEEAFVCVRDWLKSEEFE